MANLNNQKGLSIILIAIIVFFVKINAYPLHNWDEAWYAQVIKDMSQNPDHILLPFWNGRHFFDNSPLYFWLSLPIVKLFGAGAWQVRFISAAAATISTFLVYLIGKKLKDEKLGFISALVFLTLGQVVIRFRDGNLDALLTGLTLASFYFYLKSEGSKKFTILCGLSIGLSALVKAWGTALLGPFLITTYAFFKNKSLPKNLPIIILTAIFPFSWWYAWGAITYGKDFINWFILNPTSGRIAASSFNFSTYYFETLFRDAIFWLPAAAIALVIKRPKLEPWQKAFLTTSAIYLLFLSISNQKSDWYNLLVYSQIAILISGFLLPLLEKLKKIFPVFLTALILMQTYNVVRVAHIYPDRSKVGADLGIYASQTIPKNSTVILEDHDFTSFLFYSGQNQLFTLEEGKVSDFSQWWMVGKKELPGFIKNNQNVWIITKNPDSLNIHPDFQTQQQYQNYYFLKIK